MKDSASNHSIENDRREHLASFLVFTYVHTDMCTHTTIYHIHMPHNQQHLPCNRYLTSAFFSTINFRILPCASSLQQKCKDAQFLSSISLLTKSSFWLLSTELNKRENKDKDHIPSGHLCIFVSIQGFNNALIFMGNFSTLLGNCTLEVNPPG